MLPVGVVDGEIQPEELPPFHRNPELGHIAAGFLPHPALHVVGRTDAVPPQEHQFPGAAGIELRVPGPDIPVEIELHAVGIPALLCCLSPEIILNRQLQQQHPVAHRKDRELRREVRRRCRLAKRVPGDGKALFPSSDGNQFHRRNLCFGSICRTPVRNKPHGKRHFPPALQADRQNGNAMPHRRNVAETAPDHLREPPGFRPQAQFRQRLRRQVQNRYEKKGFFLLPPQQHPPDLNRIDAADRLRSEPGLHRLHRLRLRPFEVPGTGVQRQLAPFRPDTVPHHVVDHRPGGNLELELPRLNRIPDRRIQPPPVEEGVGESATDQLRREFRPRPGHKVHGRGMCGIAFVGIEPHIHSEISLRRLNPTGTECHHAGRRRTDAALPEVDQNMAGDILRTNPAGELRPRP